MKEPNTVTITIPNEVVGICSKCGKEIRIMEGSIQKEIVPMNFKFEQTGEAFGHEIQHLSCLQ